MTIISGPNMLFNPSPCEELGRGDLSQFPCQQVFFPLVTKVPLITKVFPLVIKMLPSDTKILPLI